jgi:NAD+ kinase
VLQRVAILYHPRRRHAVLEAEWLAAEMHRSGIEVALGSGWNPDDVVSLSEDRDLVVALGGDGTIIHVARLVAERQVPLLGVNLGRVGFLAELTPDTLHGQVDALVQGDFWVEDRTMLDVEWHDGEGVERFLCLNEVAVARGVSARAVHVNTLLDDHEFMTYTADAVLVVTATGSTAYSLAAGGPILYPEAGELMITPVAPHLHIGRSVILPGTTTVTLMLCSDRPAVISVDGADERALRPNHRVRVSSSPLRARFARLGPRMYFYSALADRLH